MTFANSTRCIALAAATFVLANSVSSAADVGHATRTLDSLESFLKDGTPDGLNHAEESVNSIENDLDGVDAATNAALFKRFGDDRKKVVAARFAADQKRYMANLGLKMDAARKLATPDNDNTRAGFASTSEDLTRAEKELASDDADKYLDDATRKHFSDELVAVHKKLALKTLKQDLEYATSRVQSVEESLPDFLTHAKEAETNGSPEAIDSEVRSLAGQISMEQKRVNALPDDNADAKKLVDRLNKASDTFETTVVRVQGKSALQELKTDWENRVPQTDGWAKEPAAITLAQFTGASSEVIDNLNAPKTVDMVRMANGWLVKNFGTAYPNAPIARGDNYRAFLRDGNVKALIAEVTTQRDAAETKLIAITTALLTEAEKATLTPDAREHFKKLVETTLPQTLKDSPRFKPMLVRLKALME